MKFPLFFKNKVLILLIHKTALYLAIEKENADIVRLLITNEDINVNIKSIPIKKILI